jgi:hypothetical protein
MSLVLQLAVLVARGLMSLEDLDVAPPASRELERDRMRSATDHAGQGGWPGRRSPAMRYPGAGCIQPVRNLAREWIAAHPGEWQALLRLHQTGGQPVAQPLAGLLSHRPGQAQGPGQGSAQGPAHTSQTPSAKGVHFP